MKWIDGLKEFNSTKTNWIVPRKRLAGTGDVYCNVGGVGSGRGSSAPTSGGFLDSDLSARA